MALEFTDANFKTDVLESNKLNVIDFDVADSFGIAYYANEVLTKR